MFLRPRNLFRQEPAEKPCLYGNKEKFRHNIHFGRLQVVERAMLRLVQVTSQQMVGYLGVRWTEHTRDDSVAMHIVGVSNQLRESKYKEHELVSHRILTAVCIKSFTSQRRIIQSM